MQRLPEPVTSARACSRNRRHMSTVSVPALFEDLAGHRWELTETVRDVEPEEWGGVAVAPW